MHLVYGGMDAHLKCRVRPHKQNRKMSSIPTGTELARPFMPAKDFDLSKRFYEALGFEKVLDTLYSMLAQVDSFYRGTSRKTGPRIS